MFAGYKERILVKFEREMRGGTSRVPHHKHGSNYTPPKRRHRKKKQ